MKTYDDPLLQDIATNLTSSDPGIRRVAVLELVDSGEPEAAELLILALNDPDPSVRQEPAKVVDEFDAVAFTAKIGSVQGPVRSEHGVHLIWVQSRIAGK